VPDPKKYSDKQDFMDDCMHQTKKVEGKPQAQSVAVCLNMWRNKGKKSKKCASEALRCAAQALLAAFEDNPLKGVSLPKAEDIVDPSTLWTPQQAKYVKDVLGSYYDKVHWVSAGGEISMEWRGPEHERRLLKERIKKHEPDSEVFDSGVKISWQVPMWGGLAQNAQKCAADKLNGDEPVVEGTLTKSSGEPAVRFTVEEARKHRLFPINKGMIVNLNGKGKIKLVNPVSMNGNLWWYDEVTE